MMKTLITTLNAKYIHTSLSLRLLYVASYHQHNVHFQEYTIKDSLESIALEIGKGDYQIVAFSCYIWNIEPILHLCQLLKENHPDIIIILGGPEVTYESQYFLTFDIDFVICGEGEQVFPALLTALEKQEEVIIEGVHSLAHHDSKPACVDLTYVESLDSPYLLPQDRESLSQRILYFESSRGCPFQCQYCLSSLESGLRFFSQTYLQQQLKRICQSDAKTIKCLDRSFNANVDHALMILRYIFQHAQPGQQFQFEINADVLDQRILDVIREEAPPGLLRFEIGIQSTYEPTNEAVKRRQNFPRLSEVIQQLMTDGKCELHLDLIAGLPYESFERFSQSFDDVFHFRPKELQLGFLKLLRGTSLRNDAESYGYIYDYQSPYEMIKNQWLSEADVYQIHLAEDMLEKYWNSGRFPNVMNAIMDNQPSAFGFFSKLGSFYQQQGYKKIGYQTYELFTYLDSFLESQEYHELLMYDYLAQAKTKPKRWYSPTLSLVKRKEVIHELVTQYQLDRELLFRYAIVEAFQDGYLVAIYKDYQCSITFYH